MSTVKGLAGDAIAAADGDIGHLEAIYFDDRKWDVRHLVVNATGGISALKVLVSPAAVERAGSSPTALRVALTREQVMHSPPVDRDMPVSRQYEEAGQREAAADVKDAERQASRSHLRSSEEVIGYSVHGPDGLLGHVDDLVIDDTAWKITALLVGNTRVPSSDVRAIDWKTREVRVGARRPRA